MKGQTTKRSFVAIKCNKDAMFGEEGGESLQMEAEFMMKLKHENIMQVRKIYFYL